MIFATSCRSFATLKDGIWRSAYVESVNFAFLGGEDAASTLGKVGTRTDLILYDRKEADTIRTWVVPGGFPEKIQPLFQAVNLGEYAILHVDALDRFVGEQILALDIAGMTGGILSHSHMVDHDSLMRAVRGTAVEGYKFVEPQHVREAASEFAPVRRDGDARVVIDHCFDVKGVGTVALGKVVSGGISKHDDMVLAPAGTTVNIKSIQMHDDPVDDARSPARVGLALKGVRPQEVSRGDVLYVAGASPPAASEVRIDFAKTPFYKGEPSANQMCLLSVGLQIIPAKFASADPVVLALDRPAVCTPGERCAVLKPDSPGVRIMGGGRIL